MYSSKIRLDRDHYLGSRIYFATICCVNRYPVFADLARGQRLLAMLLDCNTRHKFTMHAYCVMPDHLHLVVQDANPASNLLKFIDNFKQRTGFEYHQILGRRLWQSRFYDRILRQGDHVEDVACYVWWNPVRAGLCASPQEYPLSGSQTLDWMKWIAKTTAWLPPWKAALGENLGLPG
jgi:putative transposase